MPPLQRDLTIRNRIRSPRRHDLMTFRLSIPPVREREGRLYVYTAATSEADLTARRIHSLLDATSDRASALAGFASGLDPDDAAHLAALLKDTP